MKKVLYFLSLLSFLTLTACNFGMPRSIKVKSKANYNFTVAAVDEDYTDKISMDSLFESINSSGTGLKMYGYNPGTDNTKMQFLMEMPFQSIPLDFNSYLEGMDFNVDAMSIPVEFTIPEVGASSTQNLDLSSIEDVLNGAVTIAGLVTGQSDISFALTAAVPGEETGFDKVVYSEGCIEVKVYDFTGAIPEDVTGLIPSDDLDYTRVTLELANGKSISGTIYGGSALLDFNSYLHANELSKTGMKISFEGVEGNVPYFFVATVDQGTSKIASVEGLNYTAAPTAIPTQTFPMSLPASVKKLQIGTGSMKMKLNIPEAWEGVTASITGGLSGAITATLPESGEIDLKNTEINSGDVSFDGSLNISFKNANLDFSAKPQLDFGFNVDSLKTVTLALGENSFEPSKTFEVELPAEACAMINSITWKQSGVALTLTGDLPEGNNITLKSVDSNFFGIHEVNKVLGATAQNFYCADNVVTSIADGTKVDFAFELDAFNYDKDNGTVTLNNLEMGETYKITINAEPKIDWFKISLNLEALSASQAGNINTGLNIAEMLNPIDVKIFGETEKDSGIPKDHLLSKVELKELDMYLDCCVPSVLSDLNFKGTVNGNLVDEENNKVTGTDVRILGNTDGTAATLNKSTTPFALTFDESGSIVTNAVSTIENKASIKNLINGGKAGSLAIDYDIALAGGSGDMVLVNPNHKNDASLTASDKILNSDDGSEISLTVYIPLALDFDVKQAFTIDFLSMSGMDPDADLMNRTEKPDNSEILRYLEAIKTVYLDYKITKVPLAGTSAKALKLHVLLRDEGESEDIFNDTFDLGAGKIAINPSKVLEAYPLTGKVELTIPTGDLTVSNIMKFAANVNVGIVTDGTVSLFEQEQEEIYY